MRKNPAVSHYWQLQIHFQCSEIFSMPMYFRNCWAKYESENFEKHATIVPYQRDDAKLLHFFGKFVFFTQAHLGPCQTTLVELFVKIVNNFYFQINWRRKPFFSRRYFLVNFVKFLRIHFVQNTPATASVIYLQLLPKSPIFSLRTTHSILCFSFFDLAFVAIITCSNKLVVM